MTKISFKLLFILNLSLTTSALSPAFAADSPEEETLPKSRQEALLSHLGQNAATGELQVHFDVNDNPEDEIAAFTADSSATFINYAQKELSVLETAGMFFPNGLDSTASAREAEQFRNVQLRYEALRLALGRAKQVSEGTKPYTSYTLTIERAGWPEIQQMALGLQSYDFKNVRFLLNIGESAKAQIDVNGKLIKPDTTFFNSPTFSEAFFSLHEILGSGLVQDPAEAYSSENIRAHFTQKMYTGTVFITLQVFHEPDTGGNLQNFLFYLTQKLKRLRANESQTFADKIQEAIQFYEEALARFTSMENRVEQDPESYFAQTYRRKIPNSMAYLAVQMAREFAAAKLMSARIRFDSRPALDAFDLDRYDTNPNKPPLDSEAFTVDELFEHKVLEENCGMMLGQRTFNRKLQR